MRRLALIVGLIAFMVVPAAAGPNVNGEIIVHTNDSYTYLSTDVCTTSFGRPASCESAITRTDKSAGAVVWFVAAFLPTASPAVASVYFGIDFDEAHLDPSVGFGPCGPPGTVQAPDAGWPSHAAGNAVGFGSPIVGDTIFPFYYFRVDETTGLPGPFLCSTINPTGGYAAFYDTSMPPVQDNIHGFGCVKWYAQGSNPCPMPPPLGACCDPATGSCGVTVEDGCSAPRLWNGSWPDCAPNPCPQPLGACCDPATQACALVLQADCPPPLVWHREWTTCAPNPCLRPFGPNGNGAIIVHTNDSYTYLSTDVCTTSLGQPASCETAITRTDKSAGTVVWFLAAFQEGADPDVGSVYFGVDYDEANLDPSAKFSPCGPPGTLEIPDAGWPANNAGNSVGFAPPIDGSTLFRFYYFKVDDYSGGPPASPAFCSAINPTGGYAAFFNGAFPPVRDEIVQFGCVKWYGEGSNTCPIAMPLAACCDPYQTCTITYQAGCVPPSIWHPEWTNCAPDLCPPVFGVCCDTEGGCSLRLNENCQYPKTWHPEWTSCAPNPCPVPIGACCDMDRNCTLTTPEGCQPPSAWRWEWTSCEPNPCPSPVRACCIPVSGVCSMETQAGCQAPHVWHPEWTSCTPNPCPQPPRGACCAPDGSCSLIAHVFCYSPHIWHAEWTSCTPNPCPQPSGACCDPATGSCAFVVLAQCQAPLVWHSNWPTCDPNPCPQPSGGCCFSDGSCRVISPINCGAQHGSYQGNGSTCDPNPCAAATGACCLSNGSCLPLTYDGCAAQAGVYNGDGTGCLPNPCGVPVSCQIALTAPNGGQAWLDGTLQSIRWQKIGSCGQFVKIELLRRGSGMSSYSVCRTIASSTPNSGTFLWTAKGCAMGGALYKIRITDLISGAQDLSDQNFYILSGLGETDGGEMTFANPFRPHSSITLLLRTGAHVRIEIFDVYGHRIRMLVNRAMPSGRNEIEWDGRRGDGGQAATGIYYLRVGAGAEEFERKILLIR